MLKRPASPLQLQEIISVCPPPNKLVTEQGFFSSVCVFVFYKITFIMVFYLHLDDVIQIINICINT